MEAVSFVFGDRHTIPGFIGQGAREEVCRHLLQLKADKIMLVTEEAVDKHFADYFDCLEHVDVGDDALTEPRPKIEKMLVPSGDEAKSWDHLTRLMQWNFRVGATKKSVVVAFGGGALLNVVGLFASIAYRGMKAVYIPTTFLAMHDVVTSLKTSICFDGRKNNIGSFFAPAKILIDVDFCRTLPSSELFSGLGELAKNACLFGAQHAEGFVQALSCKKDDVDFSLDEHTLMKLIHLGIEAKMSLLCSDAYEIKNGMVFEYGHTLSHALEKAYGDGVLPHGIGVCNGMLSCSHIAEKLGIMSKADREAHDNIINLLLKRYPLPEPRPSVESIMALAMADLKRGIASEADDEISDVFVTRVGDIVPTDTNNLSKFPAKHLEEWLELRGFPRDDGKKV